MSIDQVFNLKQAAERLNISLPQLRILIREGRIKAFRPKHRLYINESELEKRLKEWEVKPEAEQETKEEAE